MRLDIEREEFTDIVLENGRWPVIRDVFESNSLFETETYIFSRCEADVTIIDKYSLDGEPRLVNWYKLYHIGRCLNIRGIETIGELEEFLDDVVRELTSL